VYQNITVYSIQGGNFGKTIIPFLVAVVTVIVVLLSVEIPSSELELSGADTLLEDVSASPK